MNAAPLLDDRSLAKVLAEIASALRDTVAMPRAAEAIEEAAKRLEDKETV
jgi:hypothetical protein